jgi:hypothetical protein
LIGIKKPGPYLGKVKLHLIAQVSRNTTQAVKGIYSQESYGKNLLYEHNVICQDVFFNGERGAVCGLKGNPWKPSPPGVSRGLIKEISK